MNIREYQKQDKQQVEHCIITLQEFERKLDIHKVKGDTIGEKYLLDLLDTIKTGVTHLRKTLPEWFEIDFHIKKME